MSMAVLVPSRGRPENIARLLEAFEATAWTAYIFTLTICVDEDDPKLPEYQALTLPFWAELAVGQRLRLGGTLNWYSLPAARYNEIVGFMGDDHVPRTDQWACRIEDAMPDLGVVYGNDLIQGAALPTAVFMDSRIVRTLGWFVLPGMTHLFMDNLWKTLGEQLGTLRYLPDVIIEHVHPIAGKAEWDAGYREANDGAVWDRDEAIYREWVAFQMPADIAKIKAAL